jgi:probable F420-dependent oxidoreductase
MQLPNPSGPSRESITAFAGFAEELGFDSLWTNSHMVIPVEFSSRHPYTPDGRAPWNAESPWVDAMVTLGFVAAITHRVRIGIDVVPLIITDPLTLAKQSATLDVLSNGRFELGVGSGWLVEEGAALGNPVDHRNGRLEEAIDVLRLAWGRPTFSYEGQFVRIPPVGINPRPPQGDGLPLWIGGKTDRAIRIAAERGAGLFLWLPKVEEIPEFRRKLRALSPTAPLASSLSFAAAGDHWREAMNRIADAGVDLLVLIRRYDPQTRADLERVAREFIA